MAGTRKIGSDDQREAAELARLLPDAFLGQPRLTLEQGDARDGDQTHG